MDEPFSALDAGLRVSIREEVRELLRLLGTTVVLVTHDQNEALSMADQVVIMRDGQVVQAGSPNGVYTNPADLETAAFLGAAVVLPGKVLVANGQGTSTEVETALGVVSVGWDSPRMTDDGDRGRRVDGGVTVVVRPEQLELTAPGATDRGASGTVGSVSFYGHDGTARVLLDDGTTEVVVRVLGLGLPDQGDRVMVSLVEGARAQIL
ncbi:MAG: TOBE domain-containing protein [Microthrixaceae bacterium]